MSDQPLKASQLGDEHIGSMIEASDPVRGVLLGVRQLQWDVEVNIDTSSDAWYLDKEESVTITPVTPEQENPPQ